MALPGQGVAYCWPSTFQKNAADCANWAHVQQMRGDTMKPSLARLSISRPWEKVKSSSMREYYFLFFLIIIIINRKAKKAKFLKLGASFFFQALVNV